MSGPREFGRNETKEFEVVLSEQPILVRLEADTWHQGARQRPAIEVNGQKAGEFEIAWPSLAQRNYTALLFDKANGPGINYSINYQGWLKASGLIKGELFVPGTNLVRISVAIDRIMMANLALEELVRFDESDSTFDFRQDQEPPPETPPAPADATGTPAPAPEPARLTQWGGSNVSHLVRSEARTDFHAFYFDGILNQQTYDVVADDQDVWIGSAAGLIRFAIPENQWFLYDRSADLQGDFARNLLLWNGQVVVEAWNRHEHDYVTPEGVQIGNNQWIPTQGKFQSDTREFVGGGALCKNLRTGKQTLFTMKDGLASDYCSDLCTDGRRIWVAHWHEEKGLSTYDLRAKKWTAVPKSANGIANIGGPRLLLNGPTLYIGQQCGLVLLNTKTLNAKHYTSRDGLPGYLISGMAAYRSEVWIAAESFEESAGLVVFSRRGETVKRASPPPRTTEIQANAPAPAPIPETISE